MPFDPFGHINQPDPEQVISFLRQQGVIPADVRDDQIMIIGMSVGIAGGEQRTDEVVQWHEGDHLPHTAEDFSDPPYMLNPEEWREALVGAVNHADDKDDFVFALKAQLGYDMHHSHDVPVDMAMDGCEKFADYLYDQYREPVS